MTLRENLIKQNKTHWLDVGCGRNFEDGFLFLDKFPKEFIDLKELDKYFQVDLLNASDDQLRFLGQFDLIRMQHVMEHFTFEDGKKVLQIIAKLLKNNGIILITVPDLKININKYLNNGYKKWPGFKMKRLFRGSTYLIEVKNPANTGQGVKEVLVDGKKQKENLIPDLRDGRTHRVEVTLG
jgi:predicted SAM-dependent methyltransferase